MITVEILLEQAQQLDRTDQLLLAERLIATAHTQPAAPTTLEPRKGEWFKGKIWIADDFDDYLGDDFWLGEDSP